VHLTLDLIVLTWPGALSSLLLIAINTSSTHSLSLSLSLVSFSLPLSFSRFSNSICISLSRFSLSTFLYLALPPSLFFSLSLSEDMVPSLPLTPGTFLLGSGEIILTTQLICFQGISASRKITTTAGVLLTDHMAPLRR
jgi:hypothetical protein